MKRTNLNTVGAVTLALLLFATCVGIAIQADNYSELEKNYNAVVLANQRQAEQTREDVSDAFKMGIITCSNEDVDFLNSIAYEYDGTPFGKIIANWADTWAYDEDTLQGLIEEYMEEEYR